MTLLDHAGRIGDDVKDLGDERGIALLGTKRAVFDVSPNERHVGKFAQSYVCLLEHTGRTIRRRDVRGVRGDGAGNVAGAAAKLDDVAQTALPGEALGEGLAKGFADDVFCRVVVQRGEVVALGGGMVRCHGAWA